MNPPINSVVVLLSAAVVLTGFSAVRSRTLLVPDEYNTIQTALNAAEDGDTVQVRPGRYLEGIDFRGREIVLLGSPEDPADTEIANPNSRVVNFTNSETENTALIGFTIRQGGCERGGGIMIQNASPRVEHCHITNNTAIMYGGGMDIEGAEAHPSVVNCRFSLNRAIRNVGGAVAVMRQAEPLFERCVFDANFAESQGGAVYIRDGFNAEFINCTFYYNSANTGGALYSENRNTLLVNCIFSDNQPQHICSFHDNGIGRYCLLYGIGRGIGGDYRLDDSFWANPELVNPREGDFRLGSFSPGINAGDPDSPPDIDGSRADIGAVVFELDPQPMLVFRPDTLFFPNTGIGSSVEREIEIRNSGAEVLEVSARVFGASFTVQMAPAEAAPNAFLTVPVRFEPRLAAQSRAGLVLYTNDPRCRQAAVPLVGRGYPPPLLSRRPEDFTEELDSGGSCETVVNLSNEGEGELIWRLELEGGNHHELRQIGNRLPTGPLSAGSFLRIYDVPLRYTSALAWDGRWIWGVGSNRLIAIDTVNGAIEIEADLFPTPDAMTFVEGRLWTAAKSEPGRFLIYDREGRFVESRESPVDTTIGLAYDGAGRLLILTSAQLLLSTPVDDISLIDHVDLLRPFDFEGFQCQDIAFMPGCYGGQLWVWCERTQTSEYYLARMWLRSDGSLSLAESFPLRCGRFPSLAHDGRNVLWGGSEIMYAWFALDDGIDQPSWLIVDPMGGRIVPQGDEDVYLTFDAYGRQPGRYEAALHFLTNEPNGADAEITATMVVRDGRTVPDADLPVPLPVTLLLEANFPNPFNDRTTFRYALPQPGAVALELFDGRGGLAKQVNAGLHAAGCHTVTLSCQDLPSGAYWARLTSGGISRVVEVQVVK